MKEIIELSHSNPSEKQKFIPLNLKQSKKKVTENNLNPRKRGRPKSTEKANKSKS